jgi:hypothetical protein
MQQGRLGHRDESNGEKTEFRLTAVFRSSPSSCLCFGCGEGQRLSGRSVNLSAHPCSDKMVSWCFTSSPQNAFMGASLVDIAVRKMIRNTQLLKQHYLNLTEATFQQACRKLTDSFSNRYQINCLHGAQFRLISANSASQQILLPSSTPGVYWTAVYETASQMCLSSVRLIKSTSFNLFPYDPF